VSKLVDEKLDREADRILSRRLARIPSRKVHEIEADKARAEWSEKFRTRVRFMLALLATAGALDETPTPSGKDDE
jgi:hypothetical protein